MFRSAVCLIIFLFSSNTFFAQDSLDSLMFKYGWKFWNQNEIIFVQGRRCDAYGDKLNKIYDEWRRNPKLIVKYEDQLDLSDLTNHLNFFGPIKSYEHLAKYLPSAVIITKNGFKLGPYTFNDSLDAISLISSECNRRFQIGNSFEAALSLWTTFQDISQYMIMQNYAITHHGFLNNDKFDKDRHYDVAALRNKNLKKFETKYYTFYYDPAIFIKNQNIDSLFSNEDAKLNNVIKILHFKYPKRKIQCFLYKDLKQKYYMSATPGFGNPFPMAYQNHSVGFGPVEHESIHILMGKASTLFSEGIVGYYYSTIDSMEWKRNKAIVSQHSGFSMKGFLTSSNDFDFSQLSYAASAFFAKYLIDTYGIDKFKSISSYTDLKKGFKEVYNKTFDEIAEGWDKYYQKNKIKLGPEREIIFKVIAENIPDTSSVYITGDNSLLGEWNPASIKLTKQRNDTWVRKFNFPEGTILYYKITRGSWGMEALDEKGNVPPNSVYEVKDDDTITIKINKWKDQK